MKVIFKKYIYIILTIFSVIITVLFSYFYQRHTDVNRYIEEVKQNLKTETEIAEDAVFKLKHHLKNDEKFTFETLSEGSKYPILIFVKKKLIYWSGHSYNISYHDILGYYINKCIKTSNAKFLVKKSFIILNNIDYEIVTLIPLERNFKVENQYLESGVNPEIFPGGGINVRIGKGKGHDIYDKFKGYLFSVNIPSRYVWYSGREWVVIIFSLLSLLFLSLQLRKHLLFSIKKGRAIYALLLLAVFLIGLRALMLYFEIPYKMIGSHFFQTNLFKPKVFASSIYSPSLGDLLLNVSVISIVFLFLFNHFPKILNYKKLLRASDNIKKIIVGVFSFFSFLVLQYSFSVLKSIYFDSQIVMDITKEVDFTLVKITCLFIFVLCAGNYFIVCHLASKMLTKFGKGLYETGLIFLGGGISFLLYSTLLKYDSYVFVFIVNNVYMFVVAVVSIPLLIHKTRYNVVIYLFLCAAAISVIGAYAMYKFHLRKDISQKHKYANKLLIENDPLGEYYLVELSKMIQNDPIIKNKFVGLFSSELITKKIRRVFYNSYLDKYDMEILFFNGIGKPYNSSLSYDSLLNQFTDDKYKSDFENILFVKSSSTGSKRYLCKVPIDRKGIRIGHIILDLKLKKLIPNSVHPNFFVDKKFETTLPNKDYSHAIFLNESVIYSYGNFYYGNGFLDNFRQASDTLDDATEKEGFQHLRVKGNNGRKIVISSPVYSFPKIFTNFSFFFLLLIFIILVTFSIYYFFVQRAIQKINFATKIQLYLNFAFFIPLIVVSLITVRILNSANANETKQHYLEKAESISADIASALTNFYRGKLTKGQLSETVLEIANLMQSDVNLFDKYGKLLAANQTYIYDNGLSAKVANPIAYIDIIERKKNEVVLEEEIGNLNFSAAYVSIKSFETGEIIGMIGIPYFGSKQKFNKQIIDVLSTILKIFTLLFITLLVIAYFSAKSLIEPLNLIIKKVQQTNLNDYNEPIKYYSDDEIGVLVDEYNKMLIKLDESKEALARTEKESAWREMAKQVAHEIKNPLTPMKLSLQQLQRVLELNDKPTNTTKANHSIKMLIEQVDILSDIVTSFSSVALMPLPKEEKFEISVILRQLINLHKHDSGLNITYEIPKGEFFVFGDSKLMVRVFTNLFLNGVQAVSSGKTAEIFIRLSEYSTHKILVEIKDNGQGIPEDIQDKVFKPNYSTKHTGSGIGLAIAKRGIEHAGGSIWFETKIDDGTSFFVEMNKAE